MKSSLFHSRLFHSGLFHGRPPSGVESTYALGFVSNGRVETTSPVLTGTGDFTISAWIYRNASGAAHCIAGNYRSPTNSNGVEFYIRANNALELYIGSAVTGSTAIQDGAWYFVAATRSAGEIRLYVNGLLDGTGTNSASITGNNNFSIGAIPFDSQEPFNGRIDDIRLYSVALTADQVAALYAGEHVTDGLTAYFPFEEGSGTSTTDEVAGLVGTLNGGVTWQPQVPPRLITGRNTEDWSVSFDGLDDVISVAHSDSLNPAHITLSLWCKLTGTPANFDGLVMKTTSDAWTDGYGLFWAGGNLQFFVDAFTANAVFPLASSDRSWHHVLGTFDGSTVRIFLDGIEGVSDTFSGSYAPSASQLEIGKGRNAASLTYTIPAIIKDVRIYSSALPAASIRKLARGVEPTETPTARWRLNEGAGTTANDSIGSNHGTLTNGPTWSSDIPPWLDATP